MAINLERFLKAKRFSTDFNLDDTTDQVLIKPASETVAGKVELATTAETGTGTSTALAVTPAGLAGALNDTATAGGNSLQKAMVNAFEQSIASDAGAQTALANAVKDEVATAISSDSSASANLMPGVTDALIADADKLQALADAMAAVTPDAFDL